MKNKTVLVIGGGPAGMMGAISAAKEGAKVILLEKNEKLGKKLFITGKGRCNITNACPVEDLFAHVVTNPKFMYSSFYMFSNEQVMDFFKTASLPIKIERGDRVFPLSDHSSDVIKCLEKEMKKLGVTIYFHETVKKIESKGNRFSKVITKSGKELCADACIIATGGQSYETTGSTGDGYRFAEALGLKVVTPRPALVPIEVKENWVKQLQGLSLRNVQIKIEQGKKTLYKEFGEMLFTHYGVSGPLILSASSFVGKALEKGPLTLKIDLKPALSVDMLDQRVLREFAENQNRQFKNAIAKMFPAKLVPVIMEQGPILPEKKVNEISRQERQEFVSYIKCFSMTLTKLRGFNEAIITQGGVSVKEMDPATMESKEIKGVYFAGEVLDLDAVTGGYNLQIAWSTGFLAGFSAAQEDKK